MKSQESKDLRRKAEGQMSEKESRLEHLGQSDLKILAHELEVHQIELEIQNEELRQSRTRAEESRDRYLDLFDFAPVGYFTLDENNRIIEANLTGCQMFQIKRTNILKKIYTKFIFPADGDRFFSLRKKILESGTRQTGELQMQTAEGIPFFAQIEGLKVGEGRLRLAVLDISERRKAEELRQMYARDLETLNKELEGFNFSISQDLKTPLRHLDSFSQILLEDYADKLDGKGKQYLQTLRKASQLATQYLNDLQLLFEASSSEISYSSVNLSKLVQTEASALRSSAPERQVDWVIEPGLKDIGDIGLLRKVITNLLDNAFKFTGSVSPARIEFGISSVENDKTYFVKDNGVGFNMAYSDKLFVPFRRLHSNKEFSGTGIGLAIAQRIIHRHNGKIWAKSELGKGATFYFTLGKE